jgi:hypothetical protein
MHLALSQRPVVPIRTLLTFTHLLIQNCLANIFKALTFTIENFLVHVLNFQEISNVIQESHFSAPFIEE